MTSVVSGFLVRRSREAAKAEAGPCSRETAEGRHLTSRAFRQTGRLRARRFGVPAVARSETPCERRREKRRSA
jgi:hypothetical protein